MVLIFFKKTRFEIFLIFKVEDRIKLLANIEMDEDLIRLREKQIKEQQKQVLPKPNIDNNNVVKDHEKIKTKEGGMSSSEVVPAGDEINNIKVQGDVDKPRIQGGQDHNSQAQKRRDTVKGVRTFFIKYIPTLVTLEQGLQEFI